MVVPTYNERENLEPMLRALGYPVVYDVTHSLQLPGGLGKATGGQSEYIENFARAGVACGVASRPSIAAVAAGGAHTLEGVTVEPSVTAAALTSLFTGVGPEVHGIRSERRLIPRPGGWRA